MTNVTSFRVFVLIAAQLVVLHFGALQMLLANLGLDIGIVIVLQRWAFLLFGGLLVVISTPPLRERLFPERMALSLRGRTKKLTMGSMQPGQNSLKKFALLPRVKACVMEQTSSFAREGTAWVHLNRIINDCVEAYDVNLHFLRLSVDKLFLPLVNEHRDDCVFVSLGIGGEITAELEFRQKYYRNCTFIGADPFRETAQVYSEVGKYFLVAIDKGSEERKLFLLNNGRYQWKTVTTTSLDKFLSHYLREPAVIPFLSLDVEGSEHRLMTSETLFSAGGTEICQISAELHGPILEMGLDDRKFAKIFLNFLRHSAFVPVKALAPGTHHRLSLINLGSEVCKEMFFE